MSLGKAFDAERIRVETAVGSEDPELVVVIEVAQSVNAFLDKVENVEGLEFLFEDADERAPDDDFHLLRKKKGADEYRRTESTSLASTVYFVFTDADAVRELLSMWVRFKEDRSVRLPQPWRKVFAQQVEDVRAWGPQDRLTRSLDEAVQAAEWERVEQISVEVELWHRRDPQARDEASRRVRDEAEACGGTVVNECVIVGIDYHALLVELPVGEVKGLGAEVAIVLQCEDEYLPGGPETPEVEEAEEWRLLYVSITRAKRRLIIGACLRRPGAGRWSGTVQTENRSLTRFLSGPRAWRCSRRREYKTAMATQ